jgi:hypothetical protein
MTKKVFSFREDLQKGLEREKQFQELFPVKLFKCETYMHDFILEDGTTTVELKSDSYDTGNFFFERYSSDKTNTPGGPWQSRSDYFCVWFTKTNHYYIFETVSLVQFLNQYIKDNNPKQIKIPNQGYTTTGYVIPIKDCVSEFFEITEPTRTSVLKNGAHHG